MSAARSRASQPAVVSLAKIGPTMSHRTRRVRGACGEIGKARVLGQIGPPERADQPGILLLAHQRHHDPAVAGPVGAGRHVQLPRCSAFQDVLGELMAEDRRRALRQADLDPLALAAALARIERDPERLRCI